MADEDYRRGDDLHRHNPWVRYPVEVGDRVRYVGAEDEAGPLRVGEEGVILQFQLDPIHPHVHVEWDRIGIGIVPLSEIRNVGDGPE